MQSEFDQIKKTVTEAYARQVPLRICGGGTKHFYGKTASPSHTVLDIRPYHGIVTYEPTELVITARAGTRLMDLQALLDQHGQILAFEPPLFGESATLGGCVATGLSGPRRASAGAVRDFVLGVRLLNGRGEDLHFGGQVMKNVAGYDISRLMTGALGTLGVLLEVSLKVLPKPSVEKTVRMEIDEASAIERVNRWAGKPLPVSATCFGDGVLSIRLSGAASAVKAAHAQLGGEVVEDAEVYWQSIREQAHVFFQSSKPLWRLAVKSTTDPMPLPGEQLIEWHGGLRWLHCDDPDAVLLIRKAAREAGGHATVFRNNSLGVAAFHPLGDSMMQIHRALKNQFDPAGILNPGRLYPEF